MDRDPPVAQDRAGGDGGGAAVRHRRRLATGAQEFLGQGAARRPRAHAAGAAAGRHRLSAVDLLRPPRTHRRIPRRSFRHRVLVPVDRRGALLRRHGISIAGASDQARDRSDRPQARRCRRDARRRPPLDIPHRHLAAGDAGTDRGHGALLRQGAGRVRRDHHFRLQYSGRDPDDFGGDLYPDPGPRRRRGGGPARAGRDRDLAGGAGGGRVARASRRHALPRGMSMLAVDVEKRLGDFSLAARFETAGGVTALFGASGAGKTTLVNMIAGLLPPDRGCIRLDDTVLFDSAARVDVPAHRRRIGYVFQEGRLFPHLSVAANLDYGRRMHGLARDSAETARILNLLDIGHLLDRRPGKLSGGERQRVAFGRALLMRPRLLLLDEPLASLDAARKREILPYLQKLRDEVPMVYVSHHAPELKRVATSVVLLEAGRVVATGGIDMLDAATAELVA